MAVENTVWAHTEVAAADLSAAQFLAVNLDGGAGVVLCGAGEKALGFLQNKPVAGEAATVMIHGLTKAVSGAAVTAGSPVEIDAAGKVIDEDSGVVVGIARTGSSGADEIISVYLV